LIVRVDDGTILVFPTKLWLIHSKELIHRAQETQYQMEASIQHRSSVRLRHLLSLHSNKEELSQLGRVMVKLHHKIRVLHHPQSV
jgi:hypothetical protein